MYINWLSISLLWILSIDRLHLLTIHLLPLIILLQGLIKLLIRLILIIISLYHEYARLLDILWTVINKLRGLGVDTRLNNDGLLGLDNCYRLLDNNDLISDIIMNIIVKPN